MIERNSTITDAKKTKEFQDYVKRIAKSKDFWKKNAEIVSKGVDRQKLDSLFEKV